MSSNAAVMAASALPVLCMANPPIAARERPLLGRCGHGGR